MNEPENFIEGQARLLERDLLLAEDHTELDALLSELTIAQRGQARAAAVVLLGDACPAAWRAEAEALLFAAERPFLGGVLGPATEPPDPALDLEGLRERMRQLGVQ